MSGHRAGEARLRLCIAALDHARGRVAKALAAYREALGWVAAQGVASDIATAHLVVADCALAAGDSGLAETAVAAARASVEESLVASATVAEVPEEGPRSGRLSRKVATVVAAAPRELLDVEAMAARVGLSKAGAGGASERQAALTQAAALRAVERVVDALALELAVADEGAMPAEDHASAQRIAVTARGLGLTPLALDAETLAWSFEGSEEALAGLEQADAQAQALDLGLLGARIRRRRVGVLMALGLRDRAEALRAVASSWARREGVGSEVTRLERLGGA